MKGKKIRLFLVMLLNGSTKEKRWNDDCKGHIGIIQKKGDSKNLLFLYYIRKIISFLFSMWFL